MLIPLLLILLVLIILELLIPGAELLDIIVVLLGIALLELDIIGVLLIDELMPLLGILEPVLLEELNPLTRLGLEVKDRNTMAKRKKTTEEGKVIVGVKEKKRI